MIRHTLERMRLDRVKRLAKENLWILIGLLCTAGGSLVQVRVLTEFLSPNQYGQLSLANTLANLVNQIVMCGLISGIGRFYSIAAEKNDLAKYLRASFRLLTYASFIIFLMGITIILGLIFDNKNQFIELVVATLIFSILTSINSSLSDLQNAARKRKVVTFNNSLDAILKIIFAWMLLKLTGVSSLSVMLGFLLAAAATLVSQLLCLKYTIKTNDTAAQTHTNAWQQQIWSYAWPFSTWGLFTWAQQASDKWALELFSTTDDVGIYAVLFQLGYVPIGMIAGIFTSFLIPIFFQRAGDGTNHTRNSNVRRVNWVITLLGLGLTIFSFLLTLLIHEWIFSIFVTEPYRSSSYLLPWFVLSGGMFATGQISALKLMSELRSRHLIPAKILTAIGGAMLNIFGAWYAGLAGVTTALVLFTATYLIWTMLLAHRTYSPQLK